MSKNICKKCNKNDITTAVDRVWEGVSQEMCADCWVKEANIDLNKAQKLKNNLSEYIDEATIKENLTRKQMEKFRDILKSEGANTIVIQDKTSEELKWALRGKSQWRKSFCFLGSIEQILSKDDTSYKFKEEEEDNRERERERAKMFELSK